MAHQSQYGGPQNTGRPGGAIKYVKIPSSKKKQTFRIVSDSATVSSLILDIKTKCGTNANAKFISVNKNAVGPAVDYDASVVRPESTVTYFRGSSIALELDGYNNSATFAATEGTVGDAPIPPDLDILLMGCLRQTIEQAALLVNVASSNDGSPKYYAPNVG